MSSLRLGGILAVTCVLACGCGSSSGGGSDSSPTATRRSSGATRTPQSGGPTPTHTGPQGPPGTRTPTPPGQRTHTATPTRAPTQPPAFLYVRAGGSDDNPGTSPDAALQTIDRAAKLMMPGTTVYVGPGHYPGRVSINGRTGSAEAAIQLLADTTGAHTGDAPGPVILDANADVVALLITKSTFITVDSFTITGAVPETMPENVSAIAVNIRQSSDNVTISNCLINSAGQADGIRIDGSSGALIFDNLISENDRGILITGAASGTRLINNTIASHTRGAISLSLKSGVAPTDTSVLNNIIEGNENHVAISVTQGPPSSVDTYTGNFNLVFEDGLADQTKAYNPSSIRGDNDVNADAMLANVGTGDVHLDTGSPAIDAGTGTIDAALVDALLKRTTSPDRAADRAPVDIGYHYPR